MNRDCLITILDKCRTLDVITASAVSVRLNKITKRDVSNRAAGYNTCLDISADLSIIDMWPKLAFSAHVDGSNISEEDAARCNKLASIYLLSAPESAKGPESRQLLKMQEWSDRIARAFVKDVTFSYS